MIKGIIDRFEGEYAIVEMEGVMKSIKRKDIPDNAREGDVMILNENHWIIDWEATDKLKRETQKLADELWR